MSILVGRESSCGLQERSLNLTEKDSFRLPRNMNRAFANESVEWAEYQVSHATTGDNLLKETVK